MLRFEGLGLLEGLKDAALTALERLGLNPDNATEVWELTVRAGGIRYNAGANRDSPRPVVRLRCPRKWIDVEWGRQRHRACLATDSEDRPGRRPV
ncbi:MAG: hypothetical protein WD651_01510 [Acidimicrobiia bacterium]